MEKQMEKSMTTPATAAPVKGKDGKDRSKKCSTNRPSKIGIPIRPASHWRSEISLSVNFFERYSPGMRSKRRFSGNGGFVRCCLLFHQRAIQRAAKNARM